MTPRKSQLGASASARKAPVSRRASSASSARTPIKNRPAPKREQASARPKRDASWFRWWLLPLVVVGAIAIFIITYYPVARVQYRETRHQAQLQAELDALQTRNQKLSVQVARLKTNEGVEDYARSQLGMVKRGEHVVVVTDGSTPSKVATSAAMTPPNIDTSTLPTVTTAGPWTRFLDSVFAVQ